MSILEISRFLLAVILFCSVVSAVKISEVELNPAGEDSGNEWLEIYSENSVDLSGWRIENAKGKNLSLNDSFSDFKVITTPYNFLANDKQKLVLYDSNENIADETDVISDSANDDRSWQYCSEWVFKTSSKGEENECEKKITEENNSSAADNKVEEESDNIESEDGNSKEEEKKAITSDAITDSFQEQETIIEPIKLVPKDIKSNEIWKSRTQKIKEYSLVGFALVCLAILIILILKNGRQNKNWEKI